jgi:hypothetical protein
MHTKAVMLIPELMKSLIRLILIVTDDLIAHRLTGKNAIQSRAKELGLHFVTANS